MGSIYKARLMNRIDNDEMLRLCSIVTRAFLPDLKRLPDYLEENTDLSLEAQSFINLGLIDNFVGGVWKDDESCCLNDTGKLLHDILSESGWFCKHSIQGYKIKFVPLLLNCSKRNKAEAKARKLEQKLKDEMIIIFQ